MPFEGRLMGAFVKRAEQLKKWQDSETNLTPVDIPKNRPSRIKFPDGCIFLAACAACDKEEVQRLLDEGADVNTINVDGLTALHQACIDENLDMVKFLVEKGADVNKHDNEGWTPLHATVSCGCISIAQYLLKKGANVAAVNNDGELPIDLAENEEMEEILQDEIDRLNIDCKAVKTLEEKIMLEDAERWANNKQLEDNVHVKTGATSLHVAAAKGYLEVMKLLIEAGADLNAQDYDGWTPIHAAAHWGQREACELLAEHLANMSIHNYVGQTCFEVSSNEIAKFLEELQSKQEMMAEEHPEIKEILQQQPKFRSLPKPTLNRSTSAERITTFAQNIEKERDVIKVQFAPMLNAEPKKVDRRDETKKVEEEIAAVPEKLVNVEPIKKKPAEPEKPVIKEPDVPPWRRRQAVPPPSAPEVKVSADELYDESIYDEIEKELEVTSKKQEENKMDTLKIKSSVPPVADERAEMQRKASAKRARESRRPTQGVTSDELKLAQKLILQKMAAKEIEQDTAQTESEDEEDEEEFVRRDDRYSPRYGSLGSLPETKSSTASSLASSCEDIDKDYKKLYFDAKEENERLTKELTKSEENLKKTKEQLQAAIQSNSRNDIEKKERRALERKISEMEEELKTLAKLKNENEKLKAENRALTRTVSKLSKKS